jgi:hypothetical protein
MKRIFAALLATTLIALGVAQARADFVSWTYNWEPSSLTLKAGTGGLSFTDEPAKSADGTSDVVVTNIRAFSSATRSNPDVITNGSMSFAMLLTDHSSGKSATLKFNGMFSGNFSATSSNVQFTPTAPITETVKLGANTYIIKLGNYAPPGPPAASNAGSLSANVFVNELPPPGPPPPPPPGLPPPPPPGTTGGSGQAPEPSTLLLSCFGLGGVGLAGLRRWRQARSMA